MNEISDLVSRWHIGRIHPTPDIEPEGWTLERLCDIARLESGHTPSRKRPDYWDGEIPWLSLHDSKTIEGKLLCNTKMTVSALGLANSSARLLPKGTVALSRTATIGKVALLGRAMATSQDFACYICGPRLSNAYLAHLFRGMEVEWERLMAGSTHNTIYMPTFENIQILVPPMAEQEAIAKALSDADALIEGLERLIAKKRLIKQGAMQDLLTAKRRLPGFSGEWETVEIGDVCTLSLAASKSSDLAPGGKYLVCDMGSVGRDGSLIAKKTVDEPRDLLSQGDLVMPKDDIGGGLIIGKAAMVPTDNRYVLGDHVYGLSPIKGDPLFLSHAINSHAVNTEIRKKVVGSAQLGLGRNSVVTQAIPWPPESEQAAISALVKDMNAEIQALETRLEKARQVKEGMMQNLLTGRIRLI